MTGPITNKVDEMVLKDAVSSWLCDPSGLGCLLTPESPKSISDPRPDAVGIRHVGGHLAGDFELIAVLIRPSTKRFASVCGEARAQSIHADRAYLACYLGTEEFAEEQIETALHLGIGLLRIDSDGRCRRLVPAPLNRPSRGMRASLSHQLGLVVCQLCGVSFSLFPDRQQDDAVLWNERWADRFGRLRNESVYDRRHLCPDCVGNISELATRDDKL